MCLLGAFEAFEFAGQSYLARQIGYAEEGVIVCTFRNPPELMVYHLPRGRLALRGLLLLLALTELTKWQYAVRKRLGHVSGVDGGLGGNATIRAQLRAFLAFLRPWRVGNEIVAQIPARCVRQPRRHWLGCLVLLCWVVWGAFIGCSVASYVLTYSLSHSDTSAFVTTFGRLLLVDRAGATFGVVGVFATMVFVTRVTWLVRGVTPSGKSQITQCSKSGTVGLELGGSRTPDTSETKWRADLRFCKAVFWLGFGSGCGSWILDYGLFAIFGESIGAPLAIIVFFVFGPIMATVSVMMSFRLIVIVFRNRKDLKIWAIAAVAAGSSVWAAINWILILDNKKF